MKKGAVVSIFVVLGFLAAAILYMTLVGEKGPQKYENYLGEIQIGILKAQQESEKAMFYADQAGKYSTYQAIYDLGQNGGYSEEGSKCTKRKYKDYGVWCEDNWPVRGKDILTENFLNYFDEYFNEYLGAYDWSYTFEDYECEFWKDIDVYKPIKCYGKKELETPILIKKIIVKPGLSGVGDCVYCNEMRDKFGLDCGQICCKADCPVGATIWNVPYYNQKELPQSACHGKTIGSSGCGPVSLKMALEFFNIGISARELMCDPYNVYNPPKTKQRGGSDPGKMATAAEKLGINAFVWKGSWEFLKGAINSGKLVIIQQSQTGAGVGKGGRCYNVNGHYILVVGISDDYVIINDPYTGRCPYETGKNLVLSKEEFLKAWGARDYNSIILGGSSGGEVSYDFSKSETETFDFKDTEFFEDVKTFKVGTYKVKHSFKHDIDYDFSDYDKIVERIKKCVGKGWYDEACLKEGNNFVWKVKEEGNFLLFDVTTDKEFPVYGYGKDNAKITDLHDVVIRFAIEI